MTWKRCSLVGATALVLITAGCGNDDKTSTTTTTNMAKLPTGSEVVNMDPARFTTNIDNPYWPMKPGNRWIYRERADGEENHVEVTVTDQIKRVNGIDTRVVHDIVTRDGRTVEDTYDWFAQDSDGNVWYMGEDTKEYDNGNVASTKGSWEAGVKGAQAGVAMPARPTVGLEYRQEYLKGEAEDAAKVLGVDESVAVPYGKYTGALETNDYTALDPKSTEHKFYVKGVGPVLSKQANGDGREELTELHLA